MKVQEFKLVVKTYERRSGKRIDHGQKTYSVRARSGVNAILGGKRDLCYSRKFGHYCEIDAIGPDGNIAAHGSARQHYGGRYGHSLRVEAWEEAAI